MGDSRARGYWRLVHKTAWGLSREHFSWAYPIATAVVIMVLDVAVRGRDKALENLSSTLIAAGAAIVVAVGIYLFNVARAGSLIYAEQLRAVDRIEQTLEAVALERDNAIQERANVLHRGATSNVDVALDAVRADVRVLGAAFVLSHDSDGLPIETGIKIEFRNLGKRPAVNVLVRLWLAYVERPKLHGASTIWYRLPVVDPSTVAQAFTQILETKQDDTPIPPRPKGSAYLIGTVEFDDPPSLKHYSNAVCFERAFGWIEGQSSTGQFTMPFGPCA